ncbi:hypothetical protein BO79DRAFT_46205 [Aspergillus costaricaensis CBS 115574]|uniref:Uncharacterized protein n=1 Tax=Aspergillus costaricaensis CBS 115574 TaxID=1448317 RepID=A0ACD1I586_9EURO|nr:hypothetical protein BO79DRAFT_46205 [Aspergillus costaricaensis CBS 115574]RAK85724.1 hypothetical protein BO79DRAFT_46205 [Aspergillus costaricaensis CBS 115574]
MTRALFRPLRPRGSRIAQTRFILLILSYLFLAKAFLGRSFPFSPVRPGYSPRLPNADIS